ncbi:MAG: hypothetical protein ACRETG_03950 [Steroidobacteraceae bacterium]
MRSVVLIVALLLGLVLEARSAAQSVVLVVREDSPITDLDSVSVRKLFLGLPVLVNGTPLRPLRNRSDDLLDQVFLQQIVAMSRSSYDRQILIGVNRQRSLRPVELSTQARVLDALYADPYAVSFTWLRDVAHNPRIRVVRVLWSD